MEYLKVLDDDSTESELVLEGYIALYGGVDLSGEYFDKSTNFESAYTRQNNILIDWEHGHEPEKGINQPGVDDILGRVEWGTAVSDDIGLLVRHVLDRRERYVSKFVEPMVRAGLIGTSSEATQKGIEKADDGRIVKWPLKRQSLTVTPMEPRLLTTNQLQVIKSLANDYPQLKSLIGGQETASDDSAEETNQHNNEDNTMSEELLKAIQEQLTAVSSELKEVRQENGQLKTTLENMPAPSKAGVITDVKDEADRNLEGNPFKGLGDFLYNLAHNHNDPRIRATRSNSDEVGEPGYYSVNKAVGDKAVKALTPSPYKATPTGLGEAVPSLGGFLVGTDNRPEILARMYNVGQILSRVDMLQVSANANGMTLNAEDETSRATGSRRGGIRAYWVAEAGEKTASTPRFRQMELKLNKVAGLVYVTDELLQDSAALGNWIQTNLPEELKFVVEDSFVRGTGAGMPLGILNSNATVSVAKETGQEAASIVYENIVKMWARRYVGAKGGYVWMVNQDTLPQLQSMSLALGVSGALVYMPPGGISAAPYSTLFGAPVIETEYNSTLGTVGDIILVAWGEYQAAEKGGVQSASSIHVRFVYDETVFRFVYRVDGQPKWAEPLTPYQGTATQSPFVTLATRS